MNAKGLRTLAAAAALALTMTRTAGAQQLLAWPIGQQPWRHLMPGQPVRPMPIQPRPDTTPVTLSGYSVEGNVEDSAADLTYRITFHNPTPQRLEGVLLVPIPADAVLSGFTMTVGGREMKGELLESGQASTIYENIVRQARDPGLLELVGERLFRARVFPIEPNADVAVRLTMSQILRKSGGLASLTVPVRSAQMTQGVRGGPASVRLRLNTTRPIRTLYSPTPRLRIARSGDRAAEAAFDGGEGREDSDVSLFFSTENDPLSAGLLTYRETGEDGYFMVSLSPRAETGTQSLPKDVVFVVDRSGSMEENGKIRQARQALAYCIRQLSPRDRFGIVDFATDWNELDAQLLPADEEHKARALRYVERIEAAGGTNIEAGLNEGFRLLAGSSGGRVPLVFFMTDGLPTVGTTDMAALLRFAQQRNEGPHARLFTFGVGADVNTLFLDKLAQANRGTGDYVQPDEDIEAKVSTLYQKVARPAMTDVRLSWEGVETAQVYPRQVNDLFHGSELVVMGRYARGGKGRLIVTGRAGERAQRFEFPIELPQSSPRLSFLPRLWANSKVASDLDAIRLSGRADPEVVNDIVKLAKRYGIVTPYTSYLITEEGRDTRMAENAAMQAVRGMALDAATSGFGGAGAAMKAKRAQAASQMLAGAAAPMAAPAPAMMAAAQDAAKKEVEERGERVVALRQAGGKTFYKRGDEWVDGDFELAGGSAKVVTLKYLSAEYFDALKADPSLGKYFALGAPLTVLRGGVAYKVSR